jgi:hypothetical protein
MAELNDVTEENLSPAVKEAFANARAGLISPTTFLVVLEEHGIGNMERLLHAHRVFGLPLKTLKELERSRGRGLNESDCDALISLSEEME